MKESRAADVLLALFEREGYVRVEPAILQPADVFVDLSGEDIRRRIFVTQDQTGAEMCLRPEYTIPVCREHLALGLAEPAAYAYGGPVFRLRTDEPGEFLQAGIESIGRADTAAADAEILGIALEGLGRLGVPDLQVQLGDMQLLDAIVDALAVPPAAKRRVVRAIVLGRGLAGVAEPENGAGTEHAGLLAAIEGQAPQAAKAFVEDILSIAGIASVGGRTAGEIAERFLARAANRTGVSDEARNVLQAYLAISGDPDGAASRIRDLARDAGLDLGGALSAFEARTGFMAARDLDIGRFSFSASFARNLDYYTGFIFEVRAPGREKPVVGGGRYDRLLQHLGATHPIPAVGCSFWLDRIGEPR